MADLKKTTLRDSPDAEQVLTNIKPHEVSIVDMPANGEPFVVIKRGEKMNPKLSSTEVPRPVMKFIVDKLNSILVDVRTLQDVSKRLPVDEKSEVKESPLPVVQLAKSIAADLRSLQPHDSIPIEKRANPASTTSIQALIKRTNDLSDIEKANAVSYLTRDQYVSVSTGIYEYLTTYVQGVESDDSGPMLIPSNLTDVVDKSATDLEKLAEDNPTGENDSGVEPDVVGDVKKLNDEIENLKKALASKTDDSVEKKGSKMAASRLKTLKSVSSGVTSASEELSKIVKELEETEEEDDMEEETKKSEEKPAVKSEAPATPAVAPTEQPAVKSEAPATSSISNEQIMAALAKFESTITSRLDTVEAGVAKATELASKSNEDVQKILVSRGEARSTGPNETVEKKTVLVSKASFASLLGIPDNK